MSIDDIGFITAWSWYWYFFNFHPCKHLPCYVSSSHPTELFTPWCHTQSFWPSYSDNPHNPQSSPELRELERYPPATEQFRPFFLLLPGIWNLVKVRGHYEPFQIHKWVTHHLQNSDESSLQKAGSETDSVWRWPGPFLSHQRVWHLLPSCRSTSVQRGLGKGLADLGNGFVGIVQDILKTKLD